MRTLKELLERTTVYFRERGIPSPRLETELLLAHVLGLDRVGVYLAFDRPMSEAEVEKVRGLVRRRGQREPLAWVLGKKEFYGRDFVVGPEVLVPRPDTETLITAALAVIGAEDPTYVADVGAGSGCIGLTLCLERPGLRLYAIDRSPAALECLRQNVAALNLSGRVAVLGGDLLAPIPAGRPVDWVVSNPPYIPSGEIAGLEPEVSQHEPRLALDGGPDGLEVYRRLVPAAARLARRGVLFEVGLGQADAVAELMAGAGLNTERFKDLGGVERVVSGLHAG